ncbi:FecR family protein [Flexithrix dorotheae]|uniref:FecR family protein n=1 Tax=Flexithrix dorotheae TaxID=70993 RepID=UPI00037189E2|nr:FecR family protein [Flexithrix dorotheae]
MEERIWELITKYLSNEASESEMEELQTFLNADEEAEQLFEQASAIWLKHKRLPSKYDLELGKAKLKSKLLQQQLKEKNQNGKVKKLKVSKKIYQTILVAASISFLLISTFIILPKYYTTPEAEVVWTEKSVPKGMRATYSMPDGSKIKVNSNSKIRFREDFAQNDVREVFLEGEAFFEVAKNPEKPFVVITNNIRTKVLGTVFNVRAYEGEHDIYVSLVEGSVAVYNKEQNNKAVPVLLTPSDQFIFNKTNSTGNIKSKTDLTSFISWKDNILIFNNEPLGKITEVLENWYGVEIIFQNHQLKNCLIKASFQNEPLNNVLEVLKYATSLHYSTNEDGIIILSGNGCP